MAPRGVGGDERSIIDAGVRLGLGNGHQCVSHTQRAHVVGFRGLHDLDELLVQTAAPQRDEHAFCSVEDPRTRTARISCARPDLSNSHSPPVCKHLFPYCRPQLVVLDTYFLAVIEGRLNVSR
jgi:hypothetical protein